jgi:thiamine biosynthesis protein ThiC
VFAILFVSDIAMSWSSYERLVSTGANWEHAGSDFETFHGGINRERITMAAHTDTASSFFSSMGESVHAFSKPNGKLQLYYLFYSFPN